MDITQILFGIAAAVGIIIVVVLAIVPTVMSMPLPAHRHRPPLRPVDGTRPRGGSPRPPQDRSRVDLAA